MKQITVKVSDKVYDDIAQKAQKSKMSISDLLISSALPDLRSNLLTLNEVLQKVNDLKSNEQFSIPSLFTPDEWKSYTNGSHISAGRMFYNSLMNNEYNLKYMVEFLGKNSKNLAQYKKL